MHARALKSLAGMSVLAIAVACAAASADGATRSVDCAPAAAQAARGHSAARASGINSYDDFIEDVVSAPDICAANIVTNDNLGAITIGLHIHDRSAFRAGDGYSIFFDTDSNSGTGSLAATGEPAGAEYEVELVSGNSSLRRWNGTSFELFPAQVPIPTLWLEGYGPVLEISQSDLGGAQSFRFIYVTSNGTDLDFAPDADAWSYTLSALELTAGPLAIGPARAGKPLVASMSVERSDFEIPLEEGAIKCAAKLSGTALAGRGAFAAERVACTWRLPRNARGKRLVGSVQIAFQGVIAKRAFSIRVR